jgi:alpha-galactosidase
MTAVRNDVQDDVESLLLSPGGSGDNSPSKAQTPSSVLNKSNTLLSPAHFDLMHGRRDNVTSAYDQSSGRHLQSSLYYSVFRVRKVSIEAFVYLLSTLVWLILRSEQHHQHSTLLAGLYLVGSFLAVFSFRGLTLQVVARLRKSDRNGRSFFVNGWNAWSFCGTVLHGHRLSLYALPGAYVRAFHDGGVGAALTINLGGGSVPYKMERDAFRPSSHGVDHIASDMFTMLADTRSRCGVVMGFLSQKAHFGCVAANQAFDRLSVHLSGDGVVVTADKVMVSDWLAIYTVRSAVNPFKTYMHLSGAENRTTSRRSGSSSLNPSGSSEQLNSHFSRLSVGPDNHSMSSLSAKRPPPPSGWSSWYHFFARVTEVDLLSNLEYVTALRTRAGFTDTFKLFQVDDGYQTAWGDWSTLNPRSFPSESLCGVAQSISDAGLTPGLWMAPFACDKVSEVATKHPEWILKRNGSKSVPANSANCGKWFYGLDVTRPEVAAHITACLQVATKVWGFRYLKLDFLYAAVLSDCHESYYDRSLTRAQVMQVAMNIVHSAVDGGGQDVYLLGCGAPLGSMVGQVHANRISAGDYNSHD